MKVNNLQFGNPNKKNNVNLYWFKTRVRINFITNNIYICRACNHAFCTIYKSIHVNNKLINIKFILIYSSCYWYFYSAK